MANKGLNPKQEEFCKNYAMGNDATAAYLRAGYACTERSARSSASALLTNPNILKKIEDIKAEGAARAEVTPEYVLTNLKEVLRRCMAENKTGKFDARNALRALELLGRYLGMFTDKTELTGVNGAPLVFGPVEVEFVGAKNENAPCQDSESL